MARAYNIIGVNNRRRILLATTTGNLDQWNDKIFVILDNVVIAMAKVSRVLQNHWF
jgi:hypothetical protein